MLIGIDSSPCSLSLGNRSTLCSTTKCHQNKSDLKNVFVQKSFFFNIFYSFNPNHAYWNQRRLFSGNLPGMFQKTFTKKLPTKQETKSESQVIRFHVEQSAQKTKWTDSDLIKSWHICKLTKPISTTSKIFILNSTSQFLLLHFRFPFCGQYILTYEDKTHIQKFFSAWIFWMHNFRFLYPKKKLA